MQTYYIQYVYSSQQGKLKNKVLGTERESLTSSQKRIHGTIKLIELVRLTSVRRNQLGEWPSQISPSIIMSAHSAPLQCG